jgi:hypothetical protein
MAQGTTTSGAATHRLRATVDGGPLAEPISEQIAALAYALWQERGCPEGAAEQDWFEAEQQVRARIDSQSEIVTALSRAPENRRVEQTVEAS